MTMESVDVTISTTSSVGITATTSSSSFALFIIVIIITSISDLQPNTPTANQLPGQLVSTEIRTMYKYKF